ncbi:hypothetical protein HDU77_003925 [Chytriomyces hyalinus]|nr:hypothetical protein HDU77_003925 [Chytriomyces hyalinus]
MKRKAESTEDTPRIHPMFSAAKTQQSDKSVNTTVNWTVSADKGLLIGTTHPLAPFASSKIASFDFDGTISLSGGSHVFSKSPDDWRFVHPSKVKARLLELHAEGFRIVIFSNQKGLLDSKKKGQGHTMESIFKGKILAVARELAIPMLIFAALDDLEYRKPSMGMWETFLSSHNEGIEPDMKASFYVGDAAGRPERTERGVSKPIKKDHSDGDLKFALNCNLPFHVPETFFGIDMNGAALVPEKWDFDPRSYSNGVPLFSPASTPLIPEDFGPNDVEVILFVGSPASGKTSFYKKHLMPHGYVHINQDTLKDRKKCIHAMLEALKSGKHCVVDNTNPTVSVRAEYIAAAKPHVKRIRAFYFTAGEELCEHNNRVRAKWTKGKGKELQRERISSVVLKMFRKNLEIPDGSKEDGIEEVKRINFLAEFEDDEHKRLWSQWH